MSPNDPTLFLNDDPIDDDDNPEWTEEDFARARPAHEILPPEILSQFANGRMRGAQKAPTKALVSLRLDPDVVAHFRATGRGWQGRMNEVLRKPQPYSPRRGSAP